MNTYEAMFLFDPSYATDFARVEQEVDRLMGRAGAQVIMSQKWDERKLAYPIKGRKRGCYVLTFFRAEPDKITGVERDAQLSEPILRLLILRADHMTEEDMRGAYLSQPESASPESRGEEDRRAEAEDDEETPKPDSKPAAKTESADTAADDDAEEPTVPATAADDPAADEEDEDHSEAG